MTETIQLRVSPQTASTPSLLQREAATRLGIDAARVNDVRITRRSIDARQKTVWVNLTVIAAIDKTKTVEPQIDLPDYRPLPPDAPTAVIVGAGPAGLFAALTAIERGVRPVVLERGRDVDTRRRDVAAISKTGIVDPDSNYCFGEGGAGTFSDGKLFTRSKKRGSNSHVLNVLVAHGASSDILIDAHPHIGSDRLPEVIKRMRLTIGRCGGEVRFGSRVTELIIEDKRCFGVRMADGTEIRGPVILATGHSARDTFRMLARDGVRIEAKPVAMGVRLEHPQRLIDRIQYHSQTGRGDFLPAAEYSFVTQVEERGVYSFCMCPGGVVVPAASAPGESVVNGMSASARASQWANSGMVVEIRPGDFPEFAKYGEFEIMELQQSLERRFYEESGSSLNAPAQRMTDFMKGRLSDSLPKSSYAPGIHSAPMHELLPVHISMRLRKGFEQFGRSSKGFLSSDAILLGLESRTSSPIRVPRDPESLSHVEIEDLYPCGEGAGYAGGIVSAAVDGERCMQKLIEKIKS